MADSHDCQHHKPLGVAIITAICRCRGVSFIYLISSQVQKNNTENVSEACDRKSGGKDRMMLKVTLSHGKSTFKILKHWTDRSVV